MRCTTPVTKAPPPTPEQREWITMRDAVGWASDLYVFTDPSREMRAVVQRLEELLSWGDHAVGLL